MSLIKKIKIEIEKLLIIIFSHTLSYIINIIIMLNN